MRIAPSFDPTADPIAWLHLETRGAPGSEAGGRWSTQSLELEPWVKSVALLIDGRMSYPGDGGTPMFWYESSEAVLRDGVDPIAALQQAQRGVLGLTAAVERAAADLERFRVERNGKHPRNPDSFEVWLRRDSGLQARYIVPHGDEPQSVRDARGAAAELAKVIRSNYERQDPL
ncbi:MAG: hypothetical protein JWO69_545 [Thermoleophilia bacterium]|nr:hypothetical protein [Thermoleophilia bacterium]